MKNTLIYDCETKRPISGNHPPEIKCCDGWHDYKGMGISVIGWQFNNEKPEYSLTVEHFEMVLEHIRPCLVVGFNSLTFDDKLLRANGVDIATDYDLLCRIRMAAGFGASWQSVPKGFSYKLDAIAQANGMAKTGSGALAPVLWQQGKEQDVIDYCLNDVRITKKILDLGLAGQLIDPNTGDKLQLLPL